MKNTKHTKEKIMSTASGVSGAASIMGSWQVCHTVCMSLVALLSAVGISVAGMPLAFLQKFAIPLWTTALVLLGIVSYFYFKNKCISKNSLILNSGFIVAGVPFQSLQKFQLIFWSFGAFLIIAGIGFYIRDKLEKKQKKKCGRCKDEK